MCWRARKCVQRMRDLMASLFFILSCLSEFWSCCKTDPSLIAASAAKTVWLAIAWTLLFSWPFIFSTAFFQLVIGVETHTHRECWSDLLPNVLHVLQKAPSLSSSYCNQWNSFPTSWSSSLIQVYYSASWEVQALNAQLQIHHPCWYLAWKPM